MAFSTKILARWATTGALSLTVEADVNPPEGVSDAQTEEVRQGLRELGLEEGVERG